MVLLLTSVAIFPLDSDYRAGREEMVQMQILQRGITDSRIVGAFSRVQRHLFVEPNLRSQAYLDLQLNIGEGQAINKPYIVAIMTYVIAPSYDKKVLEIGTGSGYQAAILAELVKEVYTIEIKESLALNARKLLDSLKYKNIRFRIGDGYVGWHEHAPYDGIIVTCSPDHIPEPLIDQLAVGGRMVIPVRYSSTVQELILLEKKRDGGLKRINLIPVQFVPLTRGKK